MTAANNLTVETNDITALYFKDDLLKSIFDGIDFTTITEKEKTQMIAATLTQSDITKDYEGRHNQG